MSLTALKVSQALWKRREKFRHDAKMKARAAGDEKNETKWNGLWLEARAKRKLRDREIAAKQNATHVSSKGLTFLKGEEGVIPYAYNDPKGFATFGVGHLLHLWSVTDADRRLWGTKSHPKPQLVNPTLRKDLAAFEQVVRLAVKPTLKQHQFDALVSLAFNIGIGAFKQSTVVRELNAGRFHSAADAMLMWSSGGLLTPRRRRERTLFLTGKYS